MIKFFTLIKIYYVLIIFGVSRKKAEKNKIINVPIKRNVYTKASIELIF